MVNFTNPGVLGDASTFRKYYEVRPLYPLEYYFQADPYAHLSFRIQYTLRTYFACQNPILTGREPDATDDARALSIERSAELSERVNQVSLQFLPMVIACCEMKFLHR